MVDLDVDLLDDHILHQALVVPMTQERAVHAADFGTAIQLADYELERSVVAVAHVEAE